MAQFLYQDYVRTLSLRFDSALAEIESQHNFELGDEFEIAVCKTLRRVLPHKCGICRGYAVSRTGETAGNDIIIFDRSRFSTLRATGDETFAQREYVPIEAIYAYIEAKHRLEITGDRGSNLFKAVEQAACVKKLCGSRERVNPEDFGTYYKIANREQIRLPYGWPKIRNPVFTAIMSRTAFSTPDKNILTDESRANEFNSIFEYDGHTPDLVIAGPNYVLLPAVPDNADAHRSIIDSPFFMPNLSSIAIRHTNGIAFGIGLISMMYAIDWIQLGILPWTQIISDGAGIPCLPE